MLYGAILFGMVSLVLGGCSAPDYMTVPPADPVGLDRRLAPSWPEQAVVRDQHLSGLRTEWRFWEEVLVRAEQDRIDACRHPEASQVNTLAHARCQWKDHLHERLSDQVAELRAQYLRAVSGSGAAGR